MPEAGQAALRGNAPHLYKEKSLKLDTEQAEVKMWRARIERQQKILQIGARVDKAIEGDKYLDGTKEAKSQRIYLRYLLPLIEDVHRKTLPAIPTPRVEARGERGELFEDQGRQLLDVRFNAPYSSVKVVCQQLLWDESRFGVAFAKTVWRTDDEEAEVESPRDPEQLAPEIERGQAENADPDSAGIAEGDVDIVHAELHFQAMEEMEDGPEREALAAHLEAHIARLTVIRRERPDLARVPVERFVYDTDVPWPERRWEAELKSERIGTLIDAGYRNVNPANLPFEAKPAEGEDTAYEDRTASIWEIHDRKNERWLIIPAQGPKDGFFLHRAVWPYAGLDIYQPLTMRPWSADSIHGAATIQVAIPILERLAQLDFNIERHIETHAKYQLGGPKSAGEPAIKAGLNNPDRRFVFEGSPESWALMKEIKPPPLPPSLMQEWERLTGELRRAVGADAQDTAAPHPHAITAKESGERAQSRQDRKTTRQETMGEFLGWIGKNYLALYKRFASQNVLVRVLGPMGVAYKEINPADVPEDIDVFLDVKGESEDAKAERLQSVHMANEFIMQGTYPVDMQKWGEYLLRAYGILRPEQFRLDIPQPMPGEEQEVPGTPGVAGAEEGRQGGQGRTAEEGRTLQFPQQTQVA